MSLSPLSQSALLSWFLQFVLKIFEACINCQPSIYQNDTMFDSLPIKDDVGSFDSFEQPSLLSLTACSEEYSRKDQNARPSLLLFFIRIPSVRRCRQPDCVRVEAAGLIDMMLHP